MRPILEKTRSEGPPSAAEWPVFDSIANCAAVTGIPKDRLRDWKSAGAPGFRGSRVYFGELLPWMSDKLFRERDAKTGLPPVITWEDVTAEQKFLERAGVLIESSKAKAFVRGVLAPLRQFIFSMPKVMAPRCNPTDPVLAHGELEKHIRQGMQMIADGEREKLGNE